MADDDAIMESVMVESLKEAQPKEETASRTAPTEDPEQRPIAEAASKLCENDIKEDEVEKEKKITKKALIEKIKKQNDEMIEEYLQEGRFVYELYAIMIH